MAVEMNHVDGLRDASQCRRDATGRKQLVSIGRTVGPVGYGEHPHAVVITVGRYIGSSLLIEDVGRQNRHTISGLNERTRESVHDTRNSPVSPGGWKVGCDLKHVQDCSSPTDTP